jgi:hypothetical protein
MKRCGSDECKLPSVIPRSGATRGEGFGTDGAKKKTSGGATTGVKNVVMEKKTKQKTNKI